MLGLGELGFGRIRVRGELGLELGTIRVRVRVFEN